MRFLFPLVMLFTALMAGIYWYLGGFRQPEVALLTTARPVFLAGQPYAGPADSDAFGQLFRQAKAVQDARQLPGDLANLYLNNPEKASDRVQAFVGLAVPDTLRPLPAGWRYRLVPAGRRVMQARLRGTSYLLAPGKLYPAAQDALNAQKLTASHLYLERFGADETAEVWVGVK